MWDAAPDQHGPAQLGSDTEPFNFQQDSWVLASLLLPVCLSTLHTLAKSEPQRCTQQTWSAQWAEMIKKWLDRVLEPETMESRETETNIQQWRNLTPEEEQEEEVLGGSSVG